MFIFGVQAPLEPCREAPSADTPGHQVTPEPNDKPMTNDQGPDRHCPVSGNGASLS
jgi:hypothetical protein